VAASLAVVLALRQLSLVAGLASAASHVVARARRQRSTVAAFERPRLFVAAAHTIPVEARPE
jgi:hypothetical protein